MTKAKRKLRRNQVKHPALNSKYNSRILSEKIDYDYLDQLSEEEKDWLAKFTEEYHKASYKHDETDIQDYETYGKDSNDRNNAQNRCLYGHIRNKASRSKENKLISYEMITNDSTLEDELSKDINPMSTENAYIDFLESKEIEAMLTEYDTAMKDYKEILYDIWP
jgi:hypothetical protein